MTTKPSAYTYETLVETEDRELDIVVAEVVMGWKWLHRINDSLCATWLLAPDTDLGCDGIPVGPFEVVASPDWPLKQKGRSFMGPEFSTAWEGFESIVQKMLAHRFKPDVRPLAGDFVEFGWLRIKISDGQNRWSHAGPFNPRTAAIAAVLAVQGDAP